MATNKIEMQYDLRQNSNEENAAYGKWYPRAVRTSTLNLKGLADHIQGHGSVYTRDLVEGVILKFKDCLVELISQGIGVKLDGLGTFYPTLEAKGSESAIGYNLASNLLGVHIRFTPEHAADERITSRALKSQVAFSQRMIFDKYGVPKKVKDGQLVDYGTDDADDSADGGEG
jgi:hypothetical protein